MPSLRKDFGNRLRTIRRERKLTQEQFAERVGIANTLLISAVVSLVESKPLSSTWRQCHLWSFPYYLVGAAVAGLVLSLDHSAGWQVSLLPLPLLYLVYRWYRVFVSSPLTASALRAPSVSASR